MFLEGGCSDSMKGRHRRPMSLPPPHPVFALFISPVWLASKLHPLQKVCLKSNVFCEFWINQASCWTWKGSDLEITQNFYWLEKCPGDFGTPKTYDWHLRLRKSYGLSPLTCEVCTGSSYLMPKFNWVVGHWAGVRELLSENILHIKLFSRMLRKCISLGDKPFNLSV